MIVEHTVVIAAPIERVWKLIDDPEQRKRWQKEQAAEIVYLTPVDPNNKKGVRFKATHKIGGKLREYNGEVIDYEPPYHHGVLYQEKYMSWQYHYRLKSTAAGTELAYSRETFTDKFPWLIRVIFQPLWSFQDRRIKPVIERGLTDLKRLAEDAAN